MPVRLSCPACHKPLSLAGPPAGPGVTCPACQAELTVPPEPDRPPRRRRGALLASVVTAAVGLAAVSAFALLREAPGAERAQAQPADLPEAGTPMPADVRPDELPDENAARAPRPAGAETGSPEAEEIAQDADPPKSTKPEPAQTPAPQPPEGPPEPAGAKPAVPAVAPAVKPQPPQPKKTPADVVRERWAAKRRSRLTDEELRQQLLLAPEVDLETVAGTSKKVISLSGKAAGTGVDVVPAVMARRPDLLGLPLRAGNLARRSREEAVNLKVLSQQLRLQVQTAMPAAAQDAVDPRPDPDLLRERLLDGAQRAAWLRPEAIPTLRQLLMNEQRTIRLLLVDLLSKIEGPQASLALAERAVFDLHPDVRLAALVALKSRPVSEYEPALIAGLRYPWPALADHAAEALVALDLRDAVPKLVPLLDARDLSEPYPVDQGSTRRAVVPELVRINHLRNCLLCHSYSASLADPVRGLAPNAEHLVPLPASGARTPTNGKSWGGGGGSRVSVVTPTFVRADITFLKQDFSVDQPVPSHGRLWPADQRYDYLVRLRPLNADGLLVWQDKLKDFRTAEAQRETLLFALRELTGEDAGPSAEDWKRLYSPVTGRPLSKPLEAAEQVLHLRDCLLEGPPRQQAERLAAFRDKGGVAYDTALVLAFPQLTAELQKVARTVLADRFFCLPFKDLRDKLADREPEVRRAAVSVCRQRKLKALVPELIGLLDDENEDVARQAHQLLQQFAGRDFGPRRGADRDDRQQAMSAWREWWEQQLRKQAAQKGPRS
jgi:hypothetical protein